MSAVFAITFMEMAMSDLFDNEWRQRLTILSITKLTITCVALFFAFDFNTIIIHTCGMVVFTMIPAVYLLNQRKTDINYIILGILALLATLPFRFLEVDFHRWFNRDDIGHVLMAIALFCFFKGVKFRESRSPNWMVA
jgi:hypothetical protein